MKPDAPQESPPAPAGRSLPRDLLLAMRPAQWTKNAVVFAAFFFALGDRQQHPASVGLWHTLAAALLFCAASSGIYLLNDIRDVEADRLHPVKRTRPLAAGRIRPGESAAAAAVLLALALAAAWALSAPVGAALTAYVAIQAGYTLWLKHIALVDVMVIASGFVLRALTGGLAARVAISPWLLLCAFLLALFLALCKRRHERIDLSDGAEAHRPSLEHYGAGLTDQLIAIAAACTILSYALYTLWPETHAKFGSYRLGFTIPFVVFGIFRYMDLVYHHRAGGRPEKVLLTDAPLLVDLALYGAAVLAVFALR